MGRFNAFVFAVMSAICDLDGRTDGWGGGLTTITPEKLRSHYDWCYDGGRLDSSYESFTGLTDIKACIYLHLVEAVFTDWGFKTAQ